MSHETSLGIAGPRRRLGNVLRRLIANPGWLVPYLQVRGRARQRERDLRRATASVFSLSDFASLLRTEQEAVLEVTGAATEAYDAARRAAWLPEPRPDDQTAWRSRVVLLRILSAVVRLAEPRIAVEIGVERGYSSAVMLRWMDERSSGRLYSIDLPPIREDTVGFTGCVIPEHLKQRWDLTLGPSQRALPELLDRLGAIDLFLHDGDHSYGPQYRDLAAVWPQLRAGGIVVVDDVWNRSLIDFADEVGEKALLVRRWDDHDGIGLLPKSL